MSVVTVSPKYQIVIPKDIRQELSVIPGQKLQLFLYAGRIELIPLQPTKSLRGSAKGINTDFVRDKDRL